MADRELRDLQRAIAAVQRRRITRYPAKLRARITAWVAKRRSEGAWWCDVARPLAIPAPTLARWAEPRPTGPVSMRPVDVIDAPPVGTVTVVTPTGLRLEGVAVADAIAILRALT
jgi:hypothetical protein